MDIEKQASEIADKALDEVRRGVSFIRASFLRAMVLSAAIVSGLLLSSIWLSLINEINNGKNFDVFIATAMAMMATPLFMVALYFYIQVTFRLLKKYRNLTDEEKQTHRKELLIAAVAASAAGWAIKLFFLPLVFFAIITLYMFKLLPVNKEEVL